MSMLKPAVAAIISLSVIGCGKMVHTDSIPIVQNNICPPVEIMLPACGPYDAPRIETYGDLLIEYHEIRKQLDGCYQQNRLWHKTWKDCKD